MDESVLENSVTGKSEARSRFCPDELSTKGASTLHSLLVAGKYADTMALPLPGNSSLYDELGILRDFLRKRPNVWVTSRNFKHYEGSVQRSLGKLPIVLFRLFWIKDGVPRQEIDETIDIDTFETLKKSKIFLEDDGVVWSSVRCFSCKGLFFLHDIDRSLQDFVYFGTDTPLMMDVVDNVVGERHFNRSLDLCTGSGVQGLHMSQRSDEQVCVDLNRRAVAFARANTAINGLTNVEAVQSDLFSNVTGRFDCISANTPYVPLALDPDAADLPLRGGDMGTEFTMRLIEALPDYLTDQGIAILYTSDPILNGRPQLQKELGERFSQLPYHMEQIMLFRNRPQDAAQEKHWQEHNLDSFDDCILVVRPGSGQQLSRRNLSTSYFWRTRVMARLALMGR